MGEVVIYDGNPLEKRRPVSALAMLLAWREINHNLSMAMLYGNDPRGWPQSTQAKDDSVTTIDGVIIDEMRDIGVDLSRSPDMTGVIVFDFEDHTAATVRAHLSELGSAIVDSYLPERLPEFGVSALEAAFQSGMRWLINADAMDALMKIHDVDIVDDDYKGPPRNRHERRKASSPRWAVKESKRQNVTKRRGCY